MYSLLTAVARVVIADWVCIVCLLVCYVLFVVIADWVCTVC